MPRGGGRDAVAVWGVRSGGQRKLVCSSQGQGSTSTVGVGKQKTRQVFALLCGVETHTAQNAQQYNSHHIRNRRSDRPKVKNEAAPELETPKFTTFISVMQLKEDCCLLCYEYANSRFSVISVAAKNTNKYAPTLEPVRSASTREVLCVLRYMQ